ncbi:unnamed protein product, partial [Discosporangium mesarthrocarpum]
HSDFVLDVRYDYYGKRLATCSADQGYAFCCLVLTCSNFPHAASVLGYFMWQGMIWRLAWAHPEFGQIIATCSADRMVKIW